MESMPQEKTPAQREKEQQDREAREKRKYITLALEAGGVLEAESLLGVVEKSTDGYLWLNAGPLGKYALPSESGLSKSDEGESLSFTVCRSNDSSFNGQVVEVGNWKHRSLAPVGNMDPKARV